MRYRKSATAARAAITVVAGASTTGSAVDARIVKALDFIRVRIRGPLKLADAAVAVTLSPGRFRHLFVQETGAAFRPYVLWLRLNVAIECSMAGGSWTEAAYEEGFADFMDVMRERGSVLHAIAAGPLETHQHK